MSATPTPSARRRRAAFRQADLARALKAAVSAGMRVAEVLVTREGDIRLVLGEPGVALSGNPLDRELGIHGSPS
jgi:hypothetical protein